MPGITYNHTVSRGGFMQVGGLNPGVGDIVAAYDTVISNGGEEMVIPGGVDVDALVQGLQVVQGSIVPAIREPLALSATVDGGGEQLLLSGGVASGTTVNWGTQDISTNSVTVLNWGREDVYRGGVASGTTVSFGGVEAVSAGAADYGATVRDGGEMKVAGIAQYDYIGGGLQDILSGGVTVASVIAGGSFNIGTQDIENGGFASSTRIFSRGEQVVSSGGRAAYTTVFSGGMEVVQSGGDALSTAVFSGGEQVVSMGGT